MTYISFQVQKVYYAPFTDLFQEYNSYTFCAILCAVLMSIALAFDIIRIERARRMLKKQTGKSAELSKSDKKSLEQYKEEFKELMAEVSIIQKDIHKLSDTLKATNSISTNNNFIMNPQSLA